MIFPSFPSFFICFCHNGSCIIYKCLLGFHSALAFHLFSLMTFKVTDLFSQPKRDNRPEEANRITDFHQQIVAHSPSPLCYYPIQPFIYIPSFEEIINFYFTNCCIRDSDTESLKSMLCYLLICVVNSTIHSPQAGLPLPLSS